MTKIQKVGLPKQKTQWQASRSCDKMVTKELTNSRLFGRHGMASSKEYLDFVLEQLSVFSLFCYFKTAQFVV